MCAARAGARNARIRALAWKFKITGAGGGRASAPPKMFVRGATACASSWRDVTRHGGPLAPSRAGPKLPRGGRPASNARTVNNLSTSARAAVGKRLAAKCARRSTRTRRHKRSHTFTES
jgi:hypothetical protein